MEETRHVEEMRAITVKGADGVIRAMVAVPESGQDVITAQLLGAGGIARAVVGLGDDGTPRIVLHDTAGRPVTMIYLDANANPHVTIIQDSNR
jgi:hypothetical protein